MLETPGCASTGAGDALRRILAGRRLKRRRRALLALVVASAVPATVTVAWRAPTLLVWNASASSPVGLYEVTQSANPRRGDRIVAWAPPAARRLAAERGYLPTRVPLVKSVAAAAGDRVCAVGGQILIDGRLAALRLARDPRRRPMPWWSGCRLLRPGELFLLSPASPLAFDGRYFGITAQNEIIGKASPLWLR